jgi:hypothetical protein
VPGAAAFAAGALWNSDAKKLNKTIEITLLVFID